MKNIKRKEFLILLIIGLLMAFFIPQVLEAKCPPEGYIKVQVPIPGLTKSFTDTKTGETCYGVGSLGEYIRDIYRYFVGIVGVLVVLMIMFGGYKWLTAAGSPEGISQAKETIMNAIIGLALVLTSYILLRTINPALVTFKELKIEPIGQIIQDGPRTQWCRDVPNPPGYELGGDTDPKCGKEYTIRQSKGQTCFGDYCASKSEVCIPYSYEGYQCIEMEEACRNDKKNECKVVDQMLAQSGSNKVCRKANRSGSKVDECQLRDILRCPQNHERLDCNVKDGADSSCWENGEPREITSGTFQIRSMCRDKAEVRAGVLTDAVCCGKNPKDQINCRSQADGCHNDEFEVDCTNYNEIKNVNYQSGGENVECSGVTECYCDPSSKICCEQMFLCTGYECRKIKS